MKSNKVTNQALGNEINTTRQAISRLLHGNTLPSIEKLILISEFFNISLDDLFGRKKLLENPDGQLNYSIKTADCILEGTLIYSFGVLNDKTFKNFLFLNDTEGRLITYILNSQSQSDFLSLAYLINQKLGLGYDAFDNNNIDLIIKVNDIYQEIYIDMPYSARVTPVSYSDYVNEWLQLSTEEKKFKIEQIYTK